jgi:uncharacterized protein DUF6152
VAERVGGDDRERGSSKGGGTMQLRAWGLAALCAVSFGLPAVAHHSHSNYAVSQFTQLEGTVKEVHWLNPHSWIYLEVKGDKGQVARWALEAASPGEITRNGVKREDVKLGDTIKVRCHRLRDGSNGCLLGFVTPLHGDGTRGHGVEREWD